VVLKRRVVREEIRIRKQRLVRQEQVSDVVRSDQIAIETTGRLEAGTSDSAVSP
jgi:stress response protein YsnF